MKGFLYHNIDLRITIGERISFYRCKSITIERSVQTMSATAKLELPREFRNAVDAGGKSVAVEGESILKHIKRGDSITISFGYDGDLEVEFEGYITAVGADIPLLLECEDEMWQLRKAARITKSITSGKLIDILKAVIPSKYTVECDAAYSIGKWLIQDSTPYEVLKELREKAHIRAFFKNPGVLRVGMVIDFKPEADFEYHFERNVRRGSQLKFKRKEDQALEVTVKSKQANGKELSYSTGEKGGNTTNITVFPGMSLADLKKWATKLYESESFDGFEGTLDGWCYPRTVPGASAVVTRPFYEDRHQDGRYFIEAVTTTVSESGGIKRSNKLTFRLS